MPEVSLSVRKQLLNNDINPATAPKIERRLNSPGIDERTFLLPKSLLRNDIKCPVFLGFEILPAGEPDRDQLGGSKQMNGRKIAQAAKVCDSGVNVATSM